MIEMKPVTIKYRDGKQKIVSLLADRCSGQIPAHSDTYYCLFYLEGAEVGRVAKSRLLPGYYEEYLRLYGRPWLKMVADLTEIHLTAFDNWESEIGGYPDNTERIWVVNNDHKTWVIECEDRSILHITNNDEQTFKGEFKTALKMLFPDKKIKVYYPTVQIVEI